MASHIRALFLFGLLVPSTLASSNDDDVDYDDYDIEESLTSDQLRKMHAKLDMDGDGKASMTEIMAHAAEVGAAMATKDVGGILEEIDLNKDGALSLDEHMQDLQTQAAGGDEQDFKELEDRKQLEVAKFRAADANGDGLLGLKEVSGFFYPETHGGVMAVTNADTMKMKDRDRDGRLSPKEFWEADEDGDDFDLSEEEAADFRTLDVDGDGLLSEAELLAWESGRFHTQMAMRSLFELADKDGDMHITADELAESREVVATSDAQYHLIEWAEHHEL